MDQPPTARAARPRAAEERAVRRPLAHALGLLGALALVGGLTACGGDDSGDSGAAKPKPSVSVSTGDDGTTTVEGDGGSVTVDEDDGTVVVEGEDGSATFSGSGTELPAGWPAAVPVVAGKILFASSTTTDGQDSFSASVEASGSAGALYSSVRDALQGAGFDAVTETTAADAAFAMFSGNGWDVVVTVGSSDGGATVVYAVTPSS